MKPEPQTVKVVCTACGLDWDAHGAKPSLAKCVELLRAELAKRPNVYPFALGTASYGHPINASQVSQLPAPNPPKRLNPKADTA